MRVSPEDQKRDIARSRFRLAVGEAATASGLDDASLLQELALIQVSWLKQHLP
jgi:hypothetical protein